VWCGGGQCWCTLTPWSRVPLEKLTSLCSKPIISPQFMEPEGSLPYSQVPATRPYPKPTPSSPHDPSNFLKIHLNIILPPTSGSPQWPLSPRFPHQHPVHPSLLPHLVGSLPYLIYDARSHEHKKLLEIMGIRTAINEAFHAEDTTDRDWPANLELSGASRSLRVKWR
jgi:hypothetical protein